MADLNDVTGGFGLWQILAFLQNCVCIFFHGIYSFNTAFLVPDNLDYWCSPPESGPWNASVWKDVGIPKIGIEAYDRCSMYATEFDSVTKQLVICKNKTVKCRSWYYDHGVYTTTFTEEWNMVCDRAWMTPIPQFATMFGYLIGDIVFGHISDIFGRRNRYISASLLFTLSLLMPLVSSDFWIYMAGRFCISFMFNSIGMYGVLFEMIPPKYRYLGVLSSGHAASLGQITLAAVMLVLRNRIVLDALMFIPAAVSLLAIVIAFESPRWLFAMKRFEEGKQTIKKIKAFNGEECKDIEEKLSDIVRKYESMETAKRRTLAYLFLNGNLRFHSLIFSLCAFVWGTAYYDTIMTSTNLGGIPHYTFMITIGIDIVSLTFCVIAVRFLPRKVVIMLCFAVIAVFSFICGFVRIDEYAVNMSLSLITRFAIVVGFYTSSVFSGEYFPTQVRAISGACIEVMFRCGASTEPFIRKYLVACGDPAVLVYLGVLAIPAAALQVFLPETLNKNLDENSKGNRQVEGKENYGATRL